MPGPAIAPRRVALVGFPGVEILDLTGPYEVFAAASLLAGERLYRLDILTSGATPLVSSSGVTLVPAGGIGEVRGAIDTLIVAGGHGVADAARDRRLVGWVRRMAPRVRRLASVCTGTFVLAAAGVLDGRRATTHWRACDDLARRHPRITVERDPIFVRDGKLYTSAGVTAGMDLALALVEADHGRQLALRIARELVMFLKRPGGQSQFSAQLALQAADREPLRELQTWIAEHLDADLSVAALAGRVAMSERNFTRVLTREVGASPARCVEQARLEGARRRLEESADGLDVVAAQCGFGSAEVMRRVFLRRLGVPPGAYRGRFRSAGHA